MSEEFKRVLEQQLWNIANTLRGKMNADEFRDYILGFIFYKYLSEKMNIFADAILKQNEIQFNKIKNLKEHYGKENDLGSELIEAIKEEALEKLGYFLRPEELFKEVAKRGKGDNEDDVEKFDESKTNFILEDLQKILNNIQMSTMGTDSEEDFDNLFEDMDLNSTKLGKTPEARNAIIAKVLSHLDKIDFKLEHTELDVLGDAYEYLIGQFASGAGKKAGEFYTPQEVSKILAKIVTTGKKKLKSVYDPTCGSGSLLLRVAREVEDVSNFYGQEMNRTTYNLARMNMILHGVHYRQFDIKQDDTLEHPQHIEKQFEAIVANPPFSAQWSANPLFTSDDRFSQYGRLAPSSKADYAFVQHMIYHLSDNGTMAIVLPHGALFRGGAEQHIRKYLIQNKNFLDAVIGLPSNIFYGTSIPTCILVFKKCRENPDDILFIDASASDHYEKVKTQNVLRKQDIDLIIETFRNRIELPKYSKKSTLEEIAKNDYNLNIPRYVDTFEAEENIDIEAIAKEIKALDETIAITNKTIAQFCVELNISTPF
jgi:type I restriction enzyme M protein